MAMLTEIKFAKVSKDAIIPSKRDEDAGYDIYPCFKEDYIRIKKHETKLIPTGIASAFSKDYYIQIEERSSTGSRGIKKSAGIIDSGYRGEWFIAITNSNDFDVYIAKDHSVKRIREFIEMTDRNDIIYPYEKAIAQAIVHKVECTTVKEIPYNELKNIESERGTGAMGSSNK